MALPAGVILAGGRSRRMGGRPKALLELDGKPLLQRVVERLQSQTSRMLLSVERADPVFEPFGLPQVPDPEPGSNGPLGGLLACMRRLASAEVDWLLLAPCDAPFLPPELGSRLLELAVAEGASGAQVRWEGEDQPTFSLWHRGLLPRLERAVTVERMAGFKQFLSSCPFPRLDWTWDSDSPEPPPFFNINDRRALERAETLLARAAETGTC